MPIRIPNNLPAIETLNKERIAIISEKRAIKQDIRPLEIAILNLMPDKITTETQLLRVLGATPLQISVTLLHTASYESKNTAADHLLSFYQTFEEIKNKRFDAIIITGAPVEHMDFKDVQYWPELQIIMDWSKSNCFGRLYICWGAQAGLYHNHNIEKRQTDKKLFGIYETKSLNPFHPLTQGFDDIFHVPVSRHTFVKESDIAAIPSLEILAKDKNGELCLVHDNDRFDTYMFNHLEYDADTLKREYDRDAMARDDVDIPLNYFPDNSPKNAPLLTWRAHRTLLFSNWINLIYQETPFDLTQLSLR